MSRNKIQKCLECKNGYYRQHICDYVYVIKSKNVEVTVPNLSYERCDKCGECIFTVDAARASYSVK